MALTVVKFHKVPPGAAYYRGETLRGVSVAGKIVATPHHLGAEDRAAADPTRNRR